MPPYYSAPIVVDERVSSRLADDTVVVNCDQQTDSFIMLKAGAEWEVLTVNDLGEDCSATPAISDGRIYIRTKNTLYYFGQGAPVTSMNRR